MTRGAGKYPREVSVPMTAQMHQFLEQLAERNHISLADVVRQAIREYLDVQEDLMCSRSRMGNRVAHQLDLIRQQMLEQQIRSDVHLLAAIILLEMRSGRQGADVLAQIAKLAAHASGDIRAVLVSSQGETKPAPSSKE